MCRSIKTLFNFEPSATDTEIKEASLQFVRKLSGFQRPSKSNEDAFNLAIDKVADDVKILLNSLITDATPHNRDVEAKRAHDRVLKRFTKE